MKPLKVRIGKNSIMCFYKMEEFKNVLKDCSFLKQGEGSSKNFEDQLENLRKNFLNLSKVSDNQNLPRGNLLGSKNFCCENKEQDDDLCEVNENRYQFRKQRQSLNIFSTSNFKESKSNIFESEKLKEGLTTSLKLGHRKSISEPKRKGNSKSEDDRTRRMLKSPSSDDGVDFLNSNFIGLESILTIDTEVNKSLISIEEKKTTTGNFSKDYKSTIKIVKKENDTDMPELNSEESTFDDEEVALDLSEPSDEVMEYAKRELGETEEVKCLTLQELRDMIYEKGECTPHRMDDAFLIRFLRARNFNVNRAHRLMVNYCNFKEDHPDIHRNVNPLEIRFIGDDDIITVPAYLTQCGRRIMIYRIGNWDPRKYSIVEIFKATVVVLELGILEPRAQIMGGVVIFDFEGLTMAHAWSVTPQIAGMVMSLIVSAFPMKSHAIHILHQSWVFDAMFSVFKPLLDSRMRDKLFFHGDNMESLHRHISPESLPKKYGGKRSELPYYKWIDWLVKNPLIVNEMQQLGYIASEEIINGFK